MRAAHHAIASTDALFAHIFHWLRVNKPEVVSSVVDDLDFRNRLSILDYDIALLRDLAKAQKHVELIRGKPMVRLASQVTVGSTGWDTGRWGEARFGGPPQVHVSTDSGEVRAVDYIVRHAMQVLLGMLDEHAM